MKTVNEQEPAVIPAAKDEIAVIAKRWKPQRGSLIMALHDLQSRFGYVPRDAAMSLGRELGVPLARISEAGTKDPTPISGRRSSKALLCRGQFTPANVWGNFCS